MHVPFSGTGNHFVAFVVTVFGEFGDFQPPLMTPDCVSPYDVFFKDKSTTHGHGINSYASSPEGTVAFP